MSDPLQTEFVKHVRKYRPDSVTARLADEAETLRLYKVAAERLAEYIELLEAQGTPVGLYSKARKKKEILALYGVEEGS
jgi:hypothetical protein